MVTEADCGKGLYRERDYDSADGLVTNCPGIPLAIFSADCIPVLLYDPVGRAIAAVHSGWRGTSLGIAPKAVAKMTALYGKRDDCSTCHPYHARPMHGKVYENRQATTKTVLE